MPAITVGGPPPVVTYRASGSPPVLSATEWTTVQLAPWGGWITVSNLNPDYTLYVAFPAPTGGVIGVQEDGTCTDSRGVAVPPLSWRTFPVLAPDGGCAPATSCGLWGGLGADHAWDLVQSSGQP